MATQRNSALEDAALVPEKQERGLNAHASRMRGRLYTGHLDRDGRVHVNQSEYQQLHGALVAAMRLGVPVQKALEGFNVALEDGNDKVIQEAEEALRTELLKHAQQMPYLDRILTVKAVRCGMMAVLNQKEAEQKTRKPSSANAAPLADASPILRILPPTLDEEEVDTRNLAHYLRRSQGVRLALAEIRQSYPVATPTQRDNLKSNFGEQLALAQVPQEDIERFVDNVVEAAMQDAGVVRRSTRGR